MRSLTFGRFGLTAGLLLAFVFSMAQFNANPSLHIGDAAPAITLKAWVRGKGVTRFERGQVYVLDFWATWCGGCIASFPRMSDYAAKYKGRVHFISVESYEDIGDNRGKDPVVVTSNFLKTKLGKNLTLDVGCDEKGNPMYVSWVKTLRRQGFPTTFVIDQEGRIAWIDVNIERLGWVLDQVLAGTWDVSRNAELMRQKDALEDLWLAKFNAKDDSSRLGICRRLLAGCDDFDRQFPDRRDASSFSRYVAVDELDRGKVPALLEEMADDPLTTYTNLTDATFLTLRRTDLTVRDYRAIARAQERLLQNPYLLEHHGGKSVELYESLGDVYRKAGDEERGNASLRLAIGLAKEEKAPVERIRELEKKVGKG